MERKRGYVYRDGDGNLWARVTYTDETGRRRNLKRRVATRAEGADVLRKLIAQVNRPAADAAVRTFRELATWYLEAYAFPAEYRDGRKVAGMRSWTDSKSILERALVPFFGDKLLREITYADLVRFKKSRLAEPTRKLVDYVDGEGNPQKRPGAPRSLAAVNRELSQLRRCLSVAKQHKMIDKNPFEEGDPLISMADERRRNRTLSFEEEVELMKVLELDPYPHLLGIVTFILDTGARPGEAMSARWADVDFEANRITIQAHNTKTLEERTVAMTPRLAALLGRMKAEPGELLFGVTTVKRSWATACRLAKISGLTLHDLRHTAGTRLAQGGMGIAEIARVLGHTQIETAFRYVNRDEKTITSAAEILSRHPKG